MAGGTPAPVLKEGEKMKAVLMSIQPEWSRLIAAGEKTVEVRKNRPKLEAPFKVYIYCTKGGDTNGYHKLFVKPKNANQYKGFCTGTVIGEFVCDRIDHLVHSGTCRQDKQLTILNSDLSYSQLTKEYLRKTYLTPEEIEAYSKGGDVYAWHITDLVIYDKPKELSEFYRKCEPLHCDCCDKLKYQRVNADEYDFDCSVGGVIKITCPPQSWCYVAD